MEQILDLINNIGNGEGFDDILAAVAAIFGLFKGGQKAKQKHAERKGKPGEVAMLTERLAKLEQQEVVATARLDAQGRTLTDLQGRTVALERDTDPKLRTWSGQR